MAPLWMPLTHEIECGVALNSPTVENLWFFNTHHISVCLKPIKRTKCLFGGWQKSAQSQQGTTTNYQLKNKNLDAFYSWSYMDYGMVLRCLIKTFCEVWC